MKTMLFSLAAAATLLTLPGVALAESAEAIHADKCVACHIATHDEAFYTRADRRITSYAGLQSMVRTCDANLGTQLFDEDMIALGDYLNEKYYKFSK